MDSVLNSGPRALLAKEQLPGQLLSERNGCPALQRCLQGLCLQTSWSSLHFSLWVQSPDRSHFSHAVRRSLETLPGQPCPPCNMATNCAPGLWGLRKVAQDELGQILRTCDLHRQLWGNVCVVCAHIYPTERLCVFYSHYRDYRLSTVCKHM